MKRAAQSPPSTEGDTTTNTNAKNANAQQPNHKAKKEKATTEPENKKEGGTKGNAKVKESPKLSMARFWAEKAESLDVPFEDSSFPINPVPRRIDYNGVIRSAAPQVIPDYEGVVDGRLALSNDAIAGILKETKPDCPKAQAWIKAHEISKAFKARREAQIMDREELRKTVARKLRNKARQAAGQSGVPKHEIKAFLEGLPEEEDDEEEEKGGVEEDTAASREAMMERVRKAHERLQKAIEEMSFN